MTTRTKWLLTTLFLIIDGVLLTVLSFDPVLILPIFALPILLIWILPQPAVSRTGRKGADDPLVQRTSRIMVGVGISFILLTGILFLPPPLPAILIGVCLGGAILWLILR